jgi:MFS family permease
MLPNSLAVMAGGQVAGHGMSRFSMRQSIIAGFCAFLLGVVFVALAPPVWGYNGDLLPAMIAIGFGSTIASLALMALSTAQVPHMDQNLASAVLMTSQQIGVALGISIVFAVIASAGDPGTAFRQAFLAAAALGVLGLAASITLTRTAPPQ